MWKQRNWHNRIVFRNAFWMVTFRLWDMFHYTWFLLRMMVRVSADGLPTSSSYSTAQHSLHSTHWFWRDGRTAHPSNIFGFIKVLKQLSILILVNKTVVKPEMSLEWQQKVENRNIETIKVTFNLISSRCFAFRPFVQDPNRADERTPTIRRATARVQQRKSLGGFNKTRNR